MTNPKMQAKQGRILGGVWGALVGDALGVPVEFTSREDRQHDPVTDMRGYGTHHQPPGTWSDDSSLMLCTMEVLCDGEYSPKRLAEIFVAWQDNGYWTPHGTVFDIGIATSSSLLRIKNGIPPEEAGGFGERDNGNGSLMRILPVAIWYADAPVEKMLFMAHSVSSLTHRHPRSLMACGLFCCIAKGLLDGLAPLDAYHFMIDQCHRYYTVAPFSHEVPRFAHILSGRIDEIPERDIASSGYVLHTLGASIWCLLHAKSFEDAVLTAVNLGEDTDTTGCVTGGIAGISYGVDGIPTALIKRLARKDDVETLLFNFCTKATGQP